MRAPPPPPPAKLSHLREKAVAGLMREKEIRGALHKAILARAARTDEVSVVNAVRAVRNRWSLRSTTRAAIVQAGKELEEKAPATVRVNVETCFSRRMARAPSPRLLAV